MKMKIRFPKALIWGNIALLLFALEGCPLPVDTVPEPPVQENTEESRGQDSKDKPENKTGENEGQNSGDGQNSCEGQDNPEKEDDENKENDDDKVPDDHEEDKNDEVLVSGKLVIRIGETAKSEGVYPDLSGVTRYLLNFNGEGGKTAEDLYLEPGKELAVTLDAGDWEIRAYGLTGNKEGEPHLAAIFGITRVTVRGNETETVLIEPNEPAAENKEQGFLSWNIGYPAATWEAGLTLSLKIEGDSFVPYKYFDLTAPGAKEQKISLPSGSYRMESRFSSHHVNTGSTEIVHIFPGLETRSMRVTIAGTEFPSAAEFSSVDNLKTYLNNLPENSGDTPYPVKITGVDLSCKDGTRETLKTLYDALNRYVTLDLRGCTGTELISASTSRLEGRKKIVSLILSESVTSIAANGFSGYDSLKSVVLPKVTTVNQVAFKELINLETISAPELITIVDDTNAKADRGNFYKCTALKSIYFPKLETIGHHAFYKCSALTEVLLPKATMLGAAVFAECTALKKAVLPEAAFIGNRAFNNDKCLEDLVLGTTPPELEGSAHFSKGFPERILVPASAVDAYKESQAWSTMTDRIYPITK